MKLEIKKEWVDEAVQKAVQKAVEEIKQNNIWIPDGMTNGDVIQALFPNGKVIDCNESVGYEQMIDGKYSYCLWFDGLWWNAPYQKGGE